MKGRLPGLTYLLLVCSLSPLFGQERTYVSIRGIFSMPLDGYSEDLGVNPHVTRRDGFDVGQGASFAANGFGAGVEISVPVGLQRLTWTSGLMILINGSNDDRLTQTFQSLVGEEEVVKFDYGNWLLMPVMTGFKYSLKLTGDLDFYGLLQGGISLIQPATRKASVSGEVVDERTYDIAHQFGYGFGGGIVIGQRLDLGVRFLDFGEPAFDGTRMLDPTYFNDSFDIIGEDVILAEKRPVSMLLFSLGYNF